MKKDIIILGAGASKAEGAPKQSELIKYFYARYKSRAFPLEKQKLYDDTIRFFKNFYGIQFNEPLNNIEFPTFEEVLGLLDLAISRKEYFGVHIKTIQSLMAMRKNLVFLIAEVLKDSLWRHNQHHQNLIRRLKIEGLLDTTSFISLNYDIIIDNQILQLNLYDEKIHYEIDYGVEFLKDYEAMSRDKTMKKSISLYKLHGSLNWLYCHSCISLKLTEKRKGASMIYGHNIMCVNDNCRANYQPIIIPPTFFKVISNYYLRQIWHKAELALRNADRIFICGYSFPDADVHIKYLIKRAELYRKYCPVVHIINWHDNKSEVEVEEEKNRFLRFFKDKGKVHYRKLSFEEFCEYGI